MTAKEHAALPHSVLVTRDGNYYVGEVVDWPGCMTQGDTVAELFEMIDEVKVLWAEHCIEHGIEIPPPKPRDA